MKNRILILLILSLLVLPIVSQASEPASASTTLERWQQLSLEQRAQMRERFQQLIQKLQWFNNRWSN